MSLGCNVYLAVWLRVHLKISEWCKNNDCPWDQESYHMLLISGDYEVIKWAEKNECVS
jgi:hypothetical protein